MTEQPTSNVEHRTSKLMREQFPPFTTLYADHDEVFLRGQWLRIGEELLRGNLQLGTRNNLPVRRAAPGARSFQPASPSRAPR